MTKRLQHIFAAFLLARFVTFSPAWADDEQAVFLSAIEDVPLMAGLTEDRAAALEFDKPDGRLVEAYAYGEIGKQAASIFYTNVMPEFGWQIASDLVFSREGEMLRIYLSAEDRLLLVRFVLSPDSSQ
ncbi:MAG: hypothetical protein HN333_13625 [Rhodospirillaceae bacterium]|nr:hypothetical protein [Rhodospirillaceae bacterium]